MDTFFKESDSRHLGVKIVVGTLLHVLLSTNEHYTTFDEYKSIYLFILFQFFFFLIIKK